MMQVPSTFAKLTAEFVGTFVLVFTACNNNMASSPMGALSIASALMVSIYALGSVSGGHFNPAVSVGLALADCVEHTGFKAAFPYSLVHLLAGAGAGLASGALWHTSVGGPSSELDSTNRTIEAGQMDHPAIALGSPGGYSSMAVCGGEMLYTAVLVFVVLNVATCGDAGRDEKNQYFGLAIGFVIIAGAVAVGHISGCCLNPAVSLGVAVSGAAFGVSSWTSMLGAFCEYAAAEFVGGCLGFGLFAACRRHHFDEHAAPVLTSKLMSEFAGTYVLVLTVALVVVQGDTAPVLGVVGIACSLMVMIYALAAVSGANFNPAVSLGLLLSRNLPALDFFAYVAAQLLGACSAVTTASSLEQKNWNVALVAHAKRSGDPNVGGMGSWGAIVGSELFYTFLLVFVVLNVAVRDAPNQYYALAIGFVIVAGGAAVGGLSGGCFNPAVAVALEFGGIFGGSGAKWGSCLMYALAESAGAVLAVVLFRMVSGTQEDSDEEGGSDEEEDGEGQGESREPLRPGDKYRPLE